MAVVLAHMLDGVLDIVANGQGPSAFGMGSALFQVCRRQRLQKLLHPGLRAFCPLLQIGRVVIGRAEFLVPLVAVDLLKVNPPHLPFSPAQQIDSRRNVVRDQPAQRAGGPLPRAFLEGFPCERGPGEIGQKFLYLSKFVVEKTAIGSDFRGIDGCHGWLLIEIGQ